MPRQMPYPLGWQMPYPLKYIVIVIVQNQPDCFHHSWITELSAAKNSVKHLKKRGTISLRGFNSLHQTKSFLQEIPQDIPNLLCFEKNNKSKRTWKENVMGLLSDYKLFDFQVTGQAKNSLKMPVYTQWALCRTWSRDLPPLNLRPGTLWVPEMKRAGKNK